MRYDDFEQVTMQVKQKRKQSEESEYKRKDPKRDKGWKNDYTANRNKKREQAE